MTARRLALVLWALGACSARPIAPPEPPPSVVRGTVKFRGIPPKPRHSKIFDVPGVPGGFRAIEEPIADADGNVRGAFVYVKKGLEGRWFPAPRTPALLFQSELMYEPRVLGIQAGQPLEVRNLDRVLHSAHALPAVNREFGMAVPPPQTFTFEGAEIMIPFQCDVHPWMRAWVGVVDHPFFAVTGEDGKFELGNLPAGKYTIGAWHERLAIEDREIEVAGETTMELIGVPR